MSLQYLHNHSTKQLHKDAIWNSQWTAKNRVITASADGSVAEWDAMNGEQTKVLPAHTLGIVSLSVPPLGEYALYNTLEGLTCLWDLKSDRGSVVGKWESYKREGGSEPAWKVSLHPDYQSYVSTGSNGQVNVHSALNSDGSAEEFGRVRGKMSTGKSKFGMSIKHSPDGNRVALATESGMISIFDLTSQSLISSYHLHAMCVRTLCWSPDNSLLISGSDDRRLTVYDVRSSPSSAKSIGGPVTALTGHSSWVLCTSISSDSRYLLSGSSDKSIKIFDLNNLKSPSAVFSASGGNGGGEVWSVCWKPMGGVGGASAWFFTAGEDGVGRFWRGAGVS